MLPGALKLPVSLNAARVVQYSHVNPARICLMTFHDDLREGDRLDYALLQASIPQREVNVSKDKNMSCHTSNTA
jgi:hypothetical protein